MAFQHIHIPFDVFCLLLRVAIEHALGVMVTAYQRMGLEQLRLDTLRVLRLNYPDSHYLKSS